MFSFFQKLNPKIKNGLFWIFILFFIYTNYFHNYWSPNKAIWDESFHIASAAKYIQKTHFMEPHPPLGKLLIAAGEVLLKSISGQSNTFMLENTEEAAKFIPTSFTPLGYRFFPVIFACLNAILFTLLLLHFLKSKLVVLAFTPLYIFENSIIAHSRAALLDNFMIFGALLSIYAYFKLLEIDFSSNNKIKIRRNGLYLVAGFSIAVLTKALGLFLLVLWPMLFIFKNKVEERRYLVKMLVPQLLIFLIFAHTVWFIHFQLGPNINPSAPNKGFYAASPTLQKILRKESIAISPIKAFYVQLADNLKFAAVYQKSVVPLSVFHGSKSGSFPMMWPFGSRPISYLENDSFDELKYMVAFVPNPVNWFFAFIGLLLVGGILFCHRSFSHFLSKHDARSLLSLCVLYLSYMLPLFFIRRILYLNHYITPLLISFLILVTIWKLFFTIHPSERIRSYFRMTLYAFPLLSISAFLFFKPLTYMDGLSCKSMNQRMILRFWDMRHPGCVHPASRNYDMYKGFPVIEN